MYLFVPYLSIHVYILLYIFLIIIHFHFSFFFLLFNLLLFSSSDFYFRFVNISPKFAPCCLEYDYTYFPDSGPIS